MSQKPHPGRYVTPSVGDKLQSCRQECFTASAESDKFCPLCSTNHCSLSRTRPHPPPGERGGGRRPSHSWSPADPTSHTHTHTHTMHSLIVGRITIKEYSVSSLCLALPGNKTKNTSLVCVCFFFLWLAGNQKKRTPQHKTFPYLSFSIVFLYRPHHTHTHTQCIHL